ncbi:hypothetical protein D3C84_439550 [compost metagenome]
MGAHRIDNDQLVPVDLIGKKIIEPRTLHQTTEKRKVAFPVLHTVIHCLISAGHLPIDRP